MRPRRTSGGGVSVEMTADELLSLAVNVANGWSLEDLGYDATERNSAALQRMLAEVYGQLLDTHRKAVERSMDKQR